MPEGDILIIDYGSGNLHSTEKAFDLVAEKLGRTVRVTSSAADLSGAGHIVLPGVGAFGECMRGLQALPGMIEALEEAVLQKRTPFLGICVGMQLLADTGFEHGTHKGLGWISGEVRALAPSDPALKVPHMGWNDLALRRPHPLLEGIRTGDHAYFVHSYAFQRTDEADILATCDYGGDVTAVIARGHIMGVQFHPEKSQGMGLRLIENFLGRAI